MYPIFAMQNALMREIGPNIIPHLFECTLQQGRSVMCDRT